VISCPFRHNYFGWVLNSPFAIDGLPSLADAPLANDPETALVLREEALPPALPDPVWSSPFITVGQDRRALIAFEESGRFLVLPGGDILFERVAGVPDKDIGALVTTVVAGVVLHQRGALPLHASSVEMNGRVFAFAGPVGRGKSVISKVLIQKGFRLCSDDITVVRFTAEGIPMASVGTLSTRLPPDAVQAIGNDESAWELVRTGAFKRSCPATAFYGSGAPLAAIIRLEVTDGRSDLSFPPYIKSRYTIGIILPKVEFTGILCY
jgi:hypothetical protein